MIKGQGEAIVLRAFVLTSLTLCISLISALFFTTSSFSYANSSSSATASVVVPVACSMSSTLDVNHSATINLGQFKEDIGTTTFKVTCNDAGGYAIYAIGYSNSEFGNTKLLATIDGQLTPTHDIVTGTATSGGVSNWAMKMIPVAGTYAPTIENGYSNYSVVPERYTKVTTFPSTTDVGATAEGSKVQSTYRAYISGTQPAGTYLGKVKYTMVHPYDTNPPEDPRFVANLDIGENINKKMKNLANNITNATSFTIDTKVKTIARASTLPNGFTPSTANTISISSSPMPVYIFFDEPSGTMYYYSEAESIKMNRTSSRMFQNVTLLTNIDALSNWNTSSVTSTESMFHSTSSLTNIDALSNWNTSSVTHMAGMFQSASSLTNIDALSNWNTSSVTRMGSMFSGASSLTNIDALSNWNTSSVGDMQSMFFGATSLTNIDGASNWNTSSVTRMGSMFAGATSLTNIDGASNWNTSSVMYMNNMFQSASSLTDISGASNWNTENVTNITYMFSDVNNIDATVLNGWNVSNVTNKTSAFSCPTNKRPSWY